MRNEALLGRATIESGETLPGRQGLIRRRPSRHLGFADA